MLRWLKKQMYQNGFMGVMGDIMREIQALQPKDTATIKWSMGVDGMEANVVTTKVTDNRLQDDVILEQEPSDPVITSEDVVVCEITGGNAQTGYNVNIFGNGPQNAYTGTGKLYATEIAYGSTLPSGTRIIGHKIAMTITGGTA